MSKSHSFKFLKYLLIALVVYNVISLLILFSPFKSLKYSLWNLMPYDYKYLVSYPTKLEKLSLLNSTNRNEIKNVLKNNEFRNALDINYWNYNLVIDSYSKEINKNFENSFLNLFFLTKNNQDKNFELKKYFVTNYKFFSENIRNIILKSY